MVECARETLVRGSRTAAITAIMAAGLVATAGCSLLPGLDSGGGEDEKTRHRVVIEVTGDDTKRADVTYVRGTEREEEPRAELPWRETLTGRRFPGVSVTAQNSGAGGTLTCTVTVDGRVLKEVSAEGEFALVICDVPRTVSPSPEAG